ncbi:amidohydrolase family protein [endosymbiont 'TC1' of Trimyema compressum]|uniref:amidohydrolase family protein n=1 Tax=endosymbiont 'TC1' of Trimyema compressum TaxID=243899 RepID=UPI000B4DCD71|nr:amidohydrolase family protein [endosymbiont 'TC1' of Trimyema compressum]
MPGETDEAQEQELHKIILYAHKKGYQVGIHATGNRSIDVSLDGFIKDIETYPGPSKRHYVIHGDMITNAWARKAIPYDVGLTLEPEVGTLIYEATTPFIGKKASRIYGVKELLDCGLWISGGSDCPITYPNWRKGLEAAVTRRSATTGNKHCPELGVSVAEGIKVYTYGGAYQERFEKVIGSIKINKVADFQVLEKDLFSVEPEALGSVDVVMTVTGGKIVYEK